MKRAALALGIAVLVLLALAHAFSPCFPLPTSDEIPASREEERRERLRQIALPFSCAEVAVRQEETGKEAYYAIDSLGEKQEISPFSDPGAETYWAGDCFDHGHGADNRLVNLELRDENGTMVQADEKQELILQQIEKLPNWVWDFKLFKREEEYFLMVSLNTNLYTPYYLYWYDSTEDQLVELAFFDNREITALRIRQETPRRGE